MNGLVVQRWPVATVAVQRARLEALHARGELVAYEPTYAGERGLALRVTVRRVLDAAPTAPRQAAPTARRRLGARRATLIGCGVGAAAAVVGVAVWALLALAGWVASHIAELLGVAVTLALLLAAVARVGGGRSGHCSGPNSGH